jgi:hypothetical protein
MVGEGVKYLTPEIFEPAAQRFRAGRLELVDVARPDHLGRDDHAVA